MAERDEKGRFKKGHGATRTGSPNKSKKALEERVLELVENNLDQIKKDLLLLSSKDRVKAITDLMKYTLPAKRAVDSTINIDALSDEQANRILETLLNKHGI